MGEMNKSKVGNRLVNGNGHIPDDVIRRDRDVKPKVFHLTGTTFSLIAILLPLLAASICVLLSLLFNFEGSTTTHCRPKVKNYLPSISSAVGDYTPQRYIWRAGIGLHSTPRLVIGVLFLNYYLSLHISCKKTLYRSLAYAAFILYNLENTALLTLTYVSSSENFHVHENSFIAFMVCSLCHMLLTCALIRWGHSHSGMSARVATGYKWCKMFFIANGLSFALAVYFFFRHNDYCEEGVYTLFAMMEYITVATNICFHGSGVISFFGGGFFKYDLPNDDLKKDY